MIERWQMSEGRVVMLATLPMLFGAVWLVGLRRPEGSNEPARAHAAAARAVSVSAADHEDGAWLGVIVAGYSADVGAEVSGSVQRGLGHGRRARQGRRAAAAHRRRARATETCAPRAPSSSSSAPRLRAPKPTWQKPRPRHAPVVDRRRRSDRVRCWQRARASNKRKAALREAQAGIGVHEADIGQQVTRNQKYIDPRAVRRHRGRALRRSRCVGRARTGRRAHHHGGLLRALCDAAVRGARAGGWAAVHVALETAW